MPVLARFYGIIIRMYFLQSEHNPPHIHAIYNEDVAAVDFMTGEVLEGHLPPKAYEHGAGMGVSPPKCAEGNVGNTGIQKAAAA